MKTTYQITLTITIVDSFDPGDYVKGSDEIASEIAQTLCDELTVPGRVVCYDVLKSLVTLQ